MKVLIVEDNFELADIYRTILNNNKIVADIVDSVREFKLKDINNYDMVLLDVNLPDGDGLNILKNIRENNKEISIIMISARVESDTLIKGLELGADDYIKKPVDFDELIARINMIHKRKNIRFENVFTLDKLSIDYDKKLIYVDGQLINLTQKQYLILESISKHYPGFISSKKLINDVYDQYVDESSSSIRVHIYNLKKKLEKYVGYEIIKSEKLKGYSLCTKEEKIN